MHCKQDGGSNPPPGDEISHWMRLALLPHIVPLCQTWWVEPARHTHTLHCISAVMLNHIHFCLSPASFAHFQWWTRFIWWKKAHGKKKNLKGSLWCIELRYNLFTPLIISAMRLQGWTQGELAQVQRALQPPLCLWMPLSWFACKHIRAVWRRRLSGVNTWCYVSSGGDRIPVHCFTVWLWKS